jgi:hypothetical protein
LRKATGNKWSQLRREAMWAAENSKTIGLGLHKVFGAYIPPSVCPGCQTWSYKI